MNLPDPESEFIAELESRFYDFLWEGKKNKISKDHVCLDKMDGGLIMINVANYITCLKISLFKVFSFSFNLLLFAQRALQ